MKGVEDLRINRAGHRQGARRLKFADRCAHARADHSVDRALIIALGEQCDLDPFDDRLDRSVRPLSACWLSARGGVASPGWALRNGK